MPKDKKIVDSNFPIRFLGAAVILTGVVVTWLGWSIHASYREAQVESERNLRLEELRGTIVHLDEVLTMSTLMAAYTGDPGWEDRYRTHEPRLADAIEDAVRLAPDMLGGETATATQAANIRLVEMEVLAFEHVRAGELEEAQQILLSDEYQAQKLVYAEAVKGFSDGLAKATRSAASARQSRARRNTIFIGFAVAMLVAGWLVTLSSISGWKKTLTTSEKKYRGLIETANDAIFITDAETGVIVDANKKASVLIGRSHKEIIGMHQTDLHPSEEVERYNRIFTDGIRDRKVIVGDVFICHADGRRIPVEISASVMETDGGKLIQGIFRDVTKRNRLQEELKRHQEDLKELVSERTAELIEMHTALQRSQKMEVVGRLASGIAHDFNNMMVAIDGLSNLGLKKARQTDPLYDYFDKIHLAAERAMNLTRQISYIGRRRPAVLAEIDINDVIENLLKILPSFVGEKIEIVSDAGRALHKVMADVGGIDQLVINLAINARDAMSGGGRLLIRTENVHVEAEDTGEGIETRSGYFVRLSVGDQGCGMDGNALGKIFEPFYTTKENGKGTGLGLAVVYGIVKSLEGWIDVESKPGEGTTFSLYLPACKRAASAKDLSKKEPLKEELLTEGGRILLVEDEEMVRLSTRMALNEGGYEVFEATDSERALEVFKQKKGEFQLALIDVTLPGAKNGMALAEELSNLNPRLPVVLMSGYTDNKSQRSSIEKMGFELIDKPFDYMQLIKIIKEKISRSGL